MLFNSTVYVVFLCLIAGIYWRLNFRSQNRFLLAASYFFYGWWDWRFLLLMIFSTVVDYLIAHRIARASSGSERKRWLIISLVLNFSILGVFKYCNFFVGSFSHLLRAAGITGAPDEFLKILLPPGISFYTFQEVAYIVDVYHRKLEPAQSFLDYALFISLFPHLIAGPIQRPSHLLPQVQQPRVWNPEKAFDGMLLILEGYFRKCVIADNCALLADAAFNGRLGPPNLAVLLLGTYAFAWQIYGDFSGYSNIARGSAQLLGFHFMVNFRQPYLAESLQKFWRRWHISLSSWLRDYLYIPLGGSRGGEAKTYRNLMTTMLLGGLWHGANWTFVLWGGLHGGGLAAERMLAREETPARRSTAAVWVRRIQIFHLVCLAWVFFRAPSVGDAFAMLRGAAVWQWRPEYLVALEFLVVFSIPLFFLDLMLENTGDEYVFQSRPAVRRVAWGVAAFCAVMLFGANRANAFIYFQF